MSHATCFCWIRRLILEVISRARCELGQALATRDGCRVSSHCVLGRALSHAIFFAQCHFHLARVKTSVMLYCRVSLLIQFRGVVTIGRFLKARQPRHRCCRAAQHSNELSKLVSERVYFWIGARNCLRWLSSYLFCLKIVSQKFNCMSSDWRHQGFSLH